MTTESNGISGISTTDNLHFACYLEASKNLIFVGCTPSGFGNKILFRFRDPHDQLDTLYSEFIQGATAPVIDVFAALHTLRRAMGAVSASSSAASSKTTREGSPLHVRHHGR